MTQEHHRTEQPKKILDTNENITNVVSKEQLNKFIKSTLNIIEKILLSSYGKYANNSLVVYDNISDISVYTTDGIHKLKALEFISPIQNYIAEQIRYIGESIEKQARDGTTTGMLFTTFIIQKIINYLDILYQELDINTFSNEFIQIPYYYNRYQFQYINSKISEHYNKIIDELLLYIKNHRIKLQDMDKSERLDIMKKIIHLTARSNANILEQPVIEIFQHLPSIFYEYFTYIRSNVETDEIVSVQYPEYDYITNMLILYGYNHFNKSSNTKFYSNDSTLIILPRTISQQDIHIVQNIEDHISTLPKDHHVVILTKTLNDQYILKVAKNLEDKYQVKVLVIQYVHYNPRVLENGIELTGLILGNKYHTDIIDHVEVTIDTHNIYINGIFDYENEVVNKETHNNDNIEFQIWINEIENTIKELKNQYEGRYDKELIKDYIHVYKKIVIPKCPILKIGGKTLEHLEMIDIVEDTLGSLSIIFKHGIVKNPYKHIMKFLYNYHSKNSLSKNNDLTFEEIIQYKAQQIDRVQLLKLYTSLLIKIYNEIKDSNKQSKLSFDVDLTQYHDIINQTIRFIIYVSMSETIIDLIKYINIDNEHELNNHIMNYKTLEQMLIRSKDIVTKLIKTQEVIVPGSVAITSSSSSKEK